MKKMGKVLISLAGMVLIVVGLLFLNGIYGNPISKSIASKTAERYVKEQYPDRDFLVEEVIYNFKDGYYHANVTSPSSIDTYFDLSIRGKEVAYDGYENEVAEGWNTHLRIDGMYRELADQVFEADDFLIAHHIAFGGIPLLPDEYEDADQELPFNEPDYGLRLSELELDKHYDVKEMGRTKGQLVFYAEEPTISFEKASEILLEVKEAFDAKGVPFYAIDFVLQIPRDEEKASEDDEEIHTSNFLYKDIYADGFAERLKIAHEKLSEYYAEQDSLNEKEKE